MTGAASTLIVAALGLVFNYRQAAGERVAAAKHAENEHKWKVQDESRKYVHEAAQTRSERYFDERKTTYIELLIAVDKLWRSAKEYETWANLEEKHYTSRAAMEADGPPESDPLADPSAREIWNRTRATVYALGTPEVRKALGDFIRAWNDFNNDARARSLLNSRPFSDVTRKSVTHAFDPVMERYDALQTAVNQDLYAIAGGEFPDLDATSPNAHSTTKRTS